MGNPSLWIMVMTGMFPLSCSDCSDRQLVTVGGVHVFERPAQCKLVLVEPSDALEVRGVAEALTLEAKREGRAEVACGSETVKLEILQPARLDIQILDADSERVVVAQSFKVQARLFDSRGRELKVGKFTVFDWTSSGVLEVANDRSAGEFGFCDTCYGLHNFRARMPGGGPVKVRFRDLEATLRISAQP